jgi:ADP-heptose:LPS heptosyltransferase
VSHQINNAVRPPKSAFKRILVIRAGALGDTAYSSSIIEPLRRQYGEDVCIDWVAKPSMGKLFSADPRINKVFELKSRRAPLLFNKGKLAIVAHALKQPYDVIVNLELGSLFNDVVRLTRSSRKIGMPYKHFAEPEDFHAVQNLQLIYGSFLDEASMAFANPSLIGTPAEVALPKYPLVKPYILLHPTTSHFDKPDYRRYRSWPVEYWQQLITLLLENRNEQVVLLGARGEEAYFQQLGNLPPEVIKLVGQTSLPDLITVIQQASALITTDTGPSHIAAAVNTPVYAIFGPSGYLKTGPYPTAENHVHVISANLPCSPCSLTPRIRQCPKNQCMYDVTPEIVFEALQNHQ